MNVTHVTVAQAANISGLKSSYIYRAIADNKLPASKMLTVSIDALLQLKTGHDSKKNGKFN